METCERLQREDASTGNNLRNRIWSDGAESDDEITNENTLLNETNEPRFVRDY
jgi:hypothetical protein